MNRSDDSSLSSLESFKKSSVQSLSGYLSNGITSFVNCYLCSHQFDSIPALRSHLEADHVDQDLHIPGFPDQHQFSRCKCNKVCIGTRGLSIHKGSCQFVESDKNEGPESNDGNNLNITFPNPSNVADSVKISSNHSNSAQPTDSLFHLFSVPQKQPNSSIPQPSRCLKKNPKHLYDFESINSNDSDSDFEPETPKSKKCTTSSTSVQPLVQSTPNSTPKKKKRSPKRNRSPRRAVAAAPVQQSPSPFLIVSETPPIELHELTDASRLLIKPLEFLPAKIKSDFLTTSDYLLGTLVYVGKTDPSKKNLLSVLSTLFLTLPGLVAILDNSSRNFLSDCAKLVRDPDNSIQVPKFIAEKILEVANLSMPGHRSKRSSPPPAPEVSRLCRQMTSDYYKGKLGSASAKLESFVKSLPAPSLSLDQARLIVADLNPEDSRDVLGSLRADLTIPEAEVTISVEDIFSSASGIKTQPKHGPSGWTNKLLKDMLLDDSNEERCQARLQALADLFTLFANDRIPAFPWTVCREVLITKDVNKFRPIGIGEVLYRFFMRVLLSKYATKVGELLPVQVGVGIPGGCEKAAVFTQFLYDKLEDSALIKLDLKNAFNLISRKRILDGLSQYCPQLIKAFLWSYSEVADLVDSDGNHLGTNEVGCRQGDPMSPLLFCVGMQECLLTTISAIEQFLSESNHTLPPQEEDDDSFSDGGDSATQAPKSYSQAVPAVAYMDDITLNTPKEAADAVFEICRDTFSSFDFVINESKSIVIGDLEPDPSKPYKISSHGDLVLGNPVGTPDYRIDEVNKSIDAVSVLVSTLLDLPLKEQIQYNILRYCLIPKLVYLCRVVGLNVKGTLPNSSSFHSFQRFDNLVDDFITRLANIKYVPTDRLVPTIRSLPRQFGGLNLTRLSWIEGFIGHNNVKAKTLLYIQNYHVGLSPLAESYLRRNIVGMTGHPMGHLAEHAPIRVYGLEPQEPHSEDVFDSQRIFTTQDEERMDVRHSLYQSCFHLLLRYFHTQGQQSRTAYFLSNCHAASGSWLSQIWMNWAPKKLQISGKHFVAALRDRLMVGPLLHPERLSGRRCLLCLASNSRAKSNVRPQKFSHHLHCPQTAGFLTDRHDLIRDIVFKYVKERKPTAELVREPQVHLLNNPSLVCADLLIKTRKLHKIIDFTVTDPTCASNLAAGSDAIEEKSIERVELEKINHYSNTDPNITLNGTFLPFAIESTGRVSKTAHNSLLKLLFPPNSMAKNKCSYNRLLALIDMACARKNAEMSCLYASYYGKEGMFGSDG